MVENQVAAVVVTGQELATEDYYFIAENIKDHGLAMFKVDDYIPQTGTWEDEECMPSGYVTYDGDLSIPTFMKFLGHFPSPELVSISFRDDNGPGEDEPVGWWFVSPKV